MFKILNEKNVLIILSIFLITFVFLSFIQNSSEKYKLVGEDTFHKLNNFEFKENLNQKLKSNKDYDIILNNDCEVTGDMHNRHKVRWVKTYFLKNFFQLADNLNPKAPYYLNIYIILFFTLFVSQLLFKKIYIIFFLLYITFIFQNYLGEYSYNFDVLFLQLYLLVKEKFIFI